MKQPASLLQRATPWLVSGASGLYIIGRSRQLSLARADDQALAKFLLHQSDVVLVLAGNHVIWHYLVKQALGNDAQLFWRTAEALSIHQLRQVFSALTLGIGLIRRRAARTSDSDTAAAIEPLLGRMQRVVDEGTRAVQVLEQTIPWL